MGGMGDDSAEVLFQSFLQDALVSSSGMGRDVHLFDIVYPAFHLPATASPDLQGALKDGLGEAVDMPVERLYDMPKPCKFPSFHICQKRVLWTHKEIDLAPHPVADVVLFK